MLEQLQRSAKRGSAPEVHAHNNTLINRLGFADQDSKIPRHDMACRYVTQPEVLRSIYGLHDVFQIRAATESVISKGEGKYRQHIGFADGLAVVDPFSCEAHLEFWKLEDRGEKPVKPKCSWPSCFSGGNILVEVKIQEVRVGELLKQLNFYRTYVTAWKTLAVLDFSITDSDEKMLNSEGIRVVRLGEGFEKWLPTQAAVATLKAI